MQADEATIKRMLGDPDEALEVWYRSLMAPQSEELVLTGMRLPDRERIGQIFDQWFERSRDTLNSLLCGKLQSKDLRAVRDEMFQVSLAAAIAAILSATKLPMPVDPVTTAVLLLARHHIDRLCGGSRRAGDQGPEV